MLNGINCIVMSEFFTLSNEIEVGTPGGNYDRSIVDEVWETATIVQGTDSALWRKDEYGTTICRSEYGNRASSFGWEIREVSPGPFEGGIPGNLKALHFDNLGD